MAKIDAGTEQSTLTESAAGRESGVPARKTTIKEYFCPLCGVSYSLAEEEGSFCMRLNSAQSVTGKELVSVEETLAMTSPREIVDRNFQLAAERLGLGKEERLLLKTPFREMKVEVPVRLDDGTFKVFIGYRVQHNGARGASQRRDSVSPSG